MKLLRKLATLSLLVVMLTTAAGSVWARAMDCCEQGDAVCLVQHLACPSCFASAPALPAAGQPIFQGRDKALAVPPPFVVISLHEHLIWKPPRHAVFTF